MTIDLFVALTTFAFVAAVTPGPNNVMLMASGLNFGFRRTLEPLFGVVFGFVLMIVVVGLGLGPVFARYPQILTALKWLGGAYMLWLAWKIATSGPAGEGQSDAKPISFLQAALLQWVNPKGWVAMVTAIATYSLPSNFVTSVFLIALVFGTVSIPSVGLWAMFGSAMKHLLNDPRYYKVFNITMAVLLVLSLAPILYH
jgi:threonine/homoserine/homoserine lactone efflux protein